MLVRQKVSSALPTWGLAREDLLSSRRAFLVWRVRQSATPRQLRLPEKEAEQILRDFRTTASDLPRESVRCFLGSGLRMAARVCRNALRGALDPDAARRRHRFLPRCSSDTDRRPRTPRNLALLFSIAFSASLSQASCAVISLFLHFSL